MTEGIRRFIIDKDTPLSLGMAIALLAIIASAGNAYFGIVETQNRIDERLGRIEHTIDKGHRWTRENMEDWTADASDVIGTDLPKPDDYVELD